MTQMTQGPQPNVEGPSGGPPSYLQSTTDSASDNDASEKSAREKFKKTSLASLSKYAVPVKVGSEREIDPSTTESVDQAATFSPEETITDDPRGRSVGKRALEDEDTNSPVRENPVANERQPDPSNGHARKRSRDVRAGEHVKGDGRLHEQREEPVQEEDEVNADKEKLGLTSQNHVEDSLITGIDDREEAGIPVHSKSEEHHVLPDADDEAPASASKPAQGLGEEEKTKAEDQEMKDGAYSPRKKRSRDQMDNEADREQKIAATEGTRAQRRSDELDRANLSSPEVTASLPSQPQSGVAASSAIEASEEGKSGIAKSDPPKATFGATNMLRPIPGPARSKSSTRASEISSSKSKESQTPAPSAFASSGFADFAASSDSPFGTVGASSKPAASSSFAFTTAPTVEKADAAVTTPSTNGGFGSFAKTPSSSSSGFGAVQSSPFATAASKAGSTFGGSVFGGGFGSAFGAGNKLTSFAAPTGDAKLGSTNGPVKPIGSPSHDSEEKEGSESEGGGEDEQSKDDETSEADDRFQHQDVETGEDGEDSIFSSRAKLYAFRDNNWKEAGNGTLKLNVMYSEDPEDEQKTGRFIMRAHSTYRVLLNQPVFPQMKVGDRLGNEPTGKAFAFAVIEDGKPIPHMVRLGDVNESKTLYHEVRKIQHGSVRETRGRMLESSEDIR